MALHDDHWYGCEDPDNCNCVDFSHCPICQGYGFVATDSFGDSQLCPNPHCDEGVVHKDYFKQPEAQASK